MISSPMFAAYIDTRDITAETLKIQRLLGQLDASKIIPTQQRSSSATGTQVAMLSMITSGLMLTTATSSRYYRPAYRPYYRPSYRPSYHRPSYSTSHRPSYHDKRYRPSYGDSYHNNDVATAIGTTMAVAGIIGMIAASAAEEAQHQAEIERIATQEKIQKEVNTIISNLVSTDTDYLAEETDLHNNLASSVDNNIKRIDTIVSKDITILSNQIQQKQDDHTTLTNKIMTTIDTLKNDSLKIREQNITKMGDSNISKREIKELKALNKEYQKLSTKKEKELKAELKALNKAFDKEFPDYQEEILGQIDLLNDNKHSRILAEVENAEKKSYNLFQKYTALYINKLSAY